MVNYVFWIWEYCFILYEIRLLIFFYLEVVKVEYGKWKIMFSYVVYEMVNGCFIIIGCK